MAAADPDVALRLAKEVADLYGDAAAQLLRLVARRLARGIDTPGWAEQKLVEIIGLRDDAIAILERVQVLGAEAARTAVEQGVATGARAATAELAGTLAPRTNTAAVDALARQLAGQLDGIRLPALRAVDDIYRTVVGEVGAPGVVTGTATRRQAAARSLDRLARQGVTGFVDRAGRRWELESYAEMATRTSSARAVVEGRLDTYEAEGRDVVIVSDAPEECSVCRPWEGRLLSISGRSVGERVDGRRVVASVREATSRGLFHANCRHDLRPYVPGLTRPYRHTADPEGDRDRQRQRALERRNRAAKRQVAAAEPFGPTPELVRARRTLAVAQADMRRFIDATGRKRLRAREQVGTAR